jgi:hypothetical protein
MNIHNLSIATFGIELETCICANKGPLKSIKMPIPFRREFRKVYTERLNQLATDNGVSASFRFEDDPRKNIDYSKWTITTDNSIRCSFRPDSDPQQYEEHYTAGKPSGKCSHFSDSAEIVTPIYSYSKEGYNSFYNVIEHVLLSDEFTYTSNSSQGMHVNVSYPGYYENDLKTLQMWWYFEPVLMTFVRTYHRGSYYVRMLRNIFPTFESIAENYASFYSDPESGPAKYTSLCKKHNRFEFRIANARMTLEHIVGWLGFCVRFVVSSQTFVKPVVYDQGTFDELFSYIDNETLKEYFKGVVVEYNDPEYNRIAQIVTRINDGNIKVSEDDFSKICKYNLMNTTTLFYQLLEKNNKALLQILVDLSNGDNEDVTLDFKKIINNWDTIHGYEILLKSVMATTTNDTYKYIIQTLLGDKQELTFKVPNHYKSAVKYLHKLLNISIEI